METLATSTDVEDRLGRSLTDDESPRVDVLLLDASAAVRGYTGQTISRGQVTIEIWSDGCGCFELPGRSPSNVSAVDADSVTVDVDRVGLRKWSAVWEGLLTVTYMQGWDPVPDDIVAVTAQMVGRALGVSLDASAVTQESTGPFSVSFGAAGSAGGLGFLPAETAVLDRYRTGAGPRLIRSTPWVV